MTKGGWSMKQRTTTRLTAAALLSTGLAMGGAWAAGDTASPSTSLEEITVTAEKRSENVQDVPIAITAFSESTLRAKGIIDLHGLTGLIPNVNLDQGSPFSGSNSVLSA